MAAFFIKKIEINITVSSSIVTLNRLLWPLRNDCKIDRMGCRKMLCPAKMISYMLY